VTAPGPAAGDFVEPAYSQRSLSDVVPAVASALGLHLPAIDGSWQDSALVLPDASSYVVFLVDGLGHELLQRYSHAAPFLSSLTSSHGTAGVPSTTATSLTSPPGFPAPTGCSTTCSGGTSPSTRWSGSRTRPPSTGWPPPASTSRRSANASSSGPD